MKAIIVSILLLFIGFIGRAQYDYVFEHYSTGDGLSHSSVSAMLRDKKGFMWFATWDGINRFDGQSFKTFKPGTGKNYNYSSSRVESMIEDAYGNIWIVTYDNYVFRWNHLTEKLEPMPNDSIGNQSVLQSSIFMSSTGDVWLPSTNEGIYRIVADSLTNSNQVDYLIGNEGGIIPQGIVTFVGEDSLKNVWINTNQGISCVEVSKNTPKVTLVPIPDETMQLLKQYEAISFLATQSFVYLGTKTGEILQIETSTLRAKQIIIENLASVNTMAGNGKGRVFFGTLGNGVFEFQENIGVISNHYNQPNIEKVLRMYVSSKKMLWIESTNPGFSKIDLTNGKYRHYQQELDVNQEIRSTAQCGLTEDRNQTVWLTLKGGGFGYYNHETDEVEYFFNKPGDPNSKLSNYIYCFYMDSTDVLWLSTYFKGIEKITLTRKRFGFVQPAPNADFSIANEVRALFEDSKGILWVATKKQELYLMDDNFRVINKIDNIDGRKIGMVYCIHEDKTGNIYLGTKGNGMYKLVRNGLTNFSAQHFVNNPKDSTSLSNNNIYSIFEDSRGLLWIGTYGGGLNLFLNGTFMNHRNGFIGYPYDKALRIRCMKEDSNGNIWIGTTNGIVYFEPGKSIAASIKFWFFNKENGGTSNLLSNDIFWIYADNKDSLWMASLGGGLAKLTSFNRAKEQLGFDVLTRENGLSSNMIFTIMGDKGGNFWMSTENGIASYSPQNQIFRNYGRYDGIGKAGFSEAACAIRSDGTFCFGANNGFYVLNPENFGNNQRKIHLEFVGFQLFGKEIQPNGKLSVLSRSIVETTKIRLKHNQNVFTISWAGLDYSMKDKISYAYILEGYEPVWHFTSDRNKADYTRIPPGKYTFKVRYNNAELQELNETKTLEIEILPPIWKTSWAYILYLICAVSLVEIARRIITSMIRLRNRVVIEKELSEIKLNFFTNISHELRTPLTLIVGPAAELQKSEMLSDKGQSYAKLIEQNAQRLLRLVNQLLDFRKVQSKKMELRLTDVDIRQFVNRLCLNFNELAIERNIHFKVETDNINLSALIDEEKMETVLYNLLSNAFKFTPNGGTITVSVLESEGNESFVISVTDSGPGVSKEMEGSLFKSFASYANTKQKNYSGTGIGLALSKELVLLHYGELTYKTAPSGGSTFSIRMKKGNQVQFSSKPIDFEEINTNDSFAVRSSVNVNENEALRHSVLVVEDNADLRTFIRIQLQSSFNVIEAINGLEGLEKALTNQPDIVLSDIMMPEMNGIEMLDKLKNNFETSHIPVVLLTAKTSVESKIEGLRYGADAYLTKPFNSEQLLAQLNNLLMQRIKLREHYSKQPQVSENLPDFTITDRDAGFLQAIQSIIEENLSNTDFKIEFIYRQVGMGRSKFFDKLKGLTGLSPIDFVREYRLNKAQSLLQTGNYNVTEVAYLSGFTDAGYFSKCYKERFGMNPSQSVRK